MEDCLSRGGGGMAEMEWRRRGGGGGGVVEPSGLGDSGRAG